MSEEDLAFGDLSGTLNVPSSAGPRPAVVALHPADGPTRDHFLFLHLARALPPIGVAVLRFDRRAGAEDRFDVQCADALAAVTALSARPDIDGTRIGLWGFSQGAWVAPLAAARSPDVAFVIVLAASGVTPGVQMRYGTAFHLRREGYGEDAVQRMLDVRAAWEAFERGAVSRDVAQIKIRAAWNESWFPLAYVPPMLPPAPGRWPTMDFDPATVFAQLRVPVLAFYGEEDEWTPIDESIDIWQRAGLRDLTIVRLPGTRHHPTLDGRDDIASIAPEYERSLIAWLDERVVHGPQR